MEYTFDELVEMLAQKIESPVEGFVPKGLEQEIALALSQVEGFKDFLKATLSADMRRHFSATADQQASIKGAFSRTAYLLALAQKGNLEQKVSTVLKGSRKTKGELINL